MGYFEYLSGVSHIQLNDQQRAAASFDEGNALVLSTAGSGKTTVIISRAGRLLYENKCKGRILTITFSKMAANDMKDRFTDCFGGRFGGRAEFSTIHAFAYRIVRDYFQRKGISFSILKNSYHILSEILKSHYSTQYFSYVADEEIESLANAIGYVNNMMADPRQCADLNIEIKGFDVLYEKYRKYKADNHLLDFDDMLIFALRVLKSSEYYINKVQGTYDYVQIDEVQDTSKIQHEIIRLVSKGNLFMVGDDDQAIYSFRGSYPEHMLNFRNIYGDGAVFYLDNNFRSDGHIVAGARAFIENNKSRFPKAIRTDNPTETEISVVKVNSRAEQCRYIINELSADRDNSQTVGILYRNNISAMILVSSLHENGVSFYLKEDRSKFFNSMVLKDVEAFLSLAVNPADRKAFGRIYYKSYTYFTKGMCRIVEEYPDDGTSVFDILMKYPYFDHYVYDKVTRFRDDICGLSKQRPKDCIRHIKLDLEYTGYLERMSDEGRSSISAGMVILEILEEVGSYCSDIREFLDKIHGMKDIIKEASENNNARVTLSTIHGAKGLEYDRVYMIDNIDGEFPPDRRNMSKEAYDRLIEEERRVFYVGMTRARKRLCVMTPEIPSLFVNELVYACKPACDTNVRAEQEVWHSKYGRGKVADVSDGIITVKFVRGKVRSFDLRFVMENGMLEIIDSGAKAAQ